MSTPLQEVGHMAQSQLKKARWALGISGALSIALGVVILVWPSISLYALVLVFGAFTLARGIVGLATAFASPIREGRGWLVFWSLVSIAVGVIVFFNTDMSALALLYVVGAYAIVLGVVAVGGAFWLPLNGGDSAVLALTGVLSIVFGIVMFASPGDGALVLLGLIAAYALIVGLAEVTVAVGGERLMRSLARQYVAPPAEAHPSR
jgi:uncharacterized membrane protein HdeD (DUF308 family)